MQPSLSLSYGSGGGNGLLGVGFRLQGVSVITRCGANYLTDGFKGGVSYDGNDRFCLNGERLINVSPDGQPPEYRTQKESWQRIVPKGTCGANADSGPCSFTLNRNDGTLVTFGYNNLEVNGKPVANNSAVPANDPALGGAIRQWMQDTSVDPNGNTMSFSYTSTPRVGTSTSDESTSGQVYLDTIQYWQSGSPQASRQINFFYQARHDPLIHFIGGGAIETNLRLREITTQIHGTGNNCGQQACDAQGVMSYTLNYFPDTHLSLLQSVQQCAASGACLTPTRFTYSGGGDSFKPQQDSDSQISGNAASFLGDFNGDGLTDILVSSASEGDTIYSAQQAPNPPGFDGGTPAGTSFALIEYASRNFGDFNGDGITDVYVNDQQNQGTLYLGKNSALTAIPLGDGISGGELLAGDYDGNGLTDLLVTTRSSGTPWLSQGTSFKSCSTSYYPASADSTYVADFNGDGRDDVLAIDGEGTGTIYFSTSDGCSATVSPPIDDLSGKHQWLADFNGDGLADFMVGAETSLTIYYGTGTTLIGDTPQSLDLNNSSASNVEPNFVGDYNGDGLVDLFASNMGTDENGAYGYLYLGSGGSNTQGGYFQCVQEDDEDCVEIPQNIDSSQSFLGDFNGDGLTDIFNADGEGSYFNWAVGVDCKLCGENQSANLLITVLDGYGGKTSITNKPITDPSVYKALAGERIAGTSNPYGATPLAASFVRPYPVKLQRSGPFVVSTYQQSGTDAAPYAYSYGLTYARAELNMLGRGWLGYKSVTVDDPQRNAKTTTIYHQDFPLDGRVAERSVCDTKKHTDCHEVPEAQLSLSRVGWKCADSQSTSEPQALCKVNNKAYVPGNTQVFFVKPQRADNADLTLGTDVVTEFQFDSWGNLQLVWARGDVRDENSVPLYTCKSYFPPDRDKWTFGFLKNRKQTAQSSCLTDISTWQSGDLQLEQYEYDKDTGNRTRILRWDEQNKGWLGALLSYTDQGLLETVGELAGATPKPVAGTTFTLGYEPAFQTFVASLTSPDPGNGAGALVRAFAYDARFGIPVGQSDANGNIINHCVDDFGRPSALQGPIEGGGKGSSNCVSASLYPYISGPFSGNTNLVTTSTYRYVADPGKGITSVEELHRSSWNAKDQDWTPLTRVLDGLGRTVAVSYVNDHGKPAAAGARYLDASLLSHRSLPAQAGEPEHWISYSYDGLGRTTQVSQPSWDLDGEMVITQDTTTYNRPNTITVTEADGTAESVTQTRRMRYYGGQAQVHTAQILGATTTIEHDALARPYKVTNPVPQSGGAVIDTRVYDSLGRVVQRSDSGSGTLDYQYDVYGNLCGIGDSLGQTVQVSWDPLRRPLAQELYEPAPGYQPGEQRDLCAPDPGPLQATITLGYDVPPGAQTNTLGQLATASINTPKTVDRFAPSISYSFGYDAWARPITRDLELGGKHKLAFGAGYDPQGRIITRTYPEVNGQRPRTDISYWTGNGRLRDIAYSAAGGEAYPWLQFSEYNAFNQAQSASYRATGAHEAWGYQADGLLATHVVRDRTDGRLINDAFGWNQRDSIETILDCNAENNSSRAACQGNAGQSPNDSSLTYTYDPVQRLKTVGGAMDNTYCYDDAGNRVLSNGVVFAYEGNQVQTGSTATDAGNCKSGSSGTVFSAQYNVNGAMTSRQTGADLETTLGLEYSVKGWLLESTLNGALHQRSAYDFRGRRVVRAVYQDDGKTLDRALVTLAADFEVELVNGKGAEYTVYLNDARGKFAALTDTLPAEDARSLAQALGLEIDLEDRESEASPEKPQSLVFHRDQVGSTEVVTDADGLRYATVTYDPWGTPSIDPEKNNRFRPLFGGKEYSSATGLYDFEARHYDTFSGRFVSADTQTAAGPLTPDGFNDYAYVLNNPVVYADPSGHFPVRALIDAAKITRLAVSVLTDTEEFLPEEDALEDRAVKQIVHDSRRSEQGARSTAGGVSEDASGNATCKRRNSFVAGTEVVTADGPVEIEAISVGDQVWSYNERTAELETNLVTGIFNGSHEVLVIVVVDDTVIETTAEHPFYVKGKGWIEAGLLEPGQVLVTLDEQEVTIDSVRVEDTDEPFFAYNFTVDQARNYFVSPDAVLVHNPDCYWAGPADPDEGIEANPGIQPHHFDRNQGFSVTVDYDQAQNRVAVGGIRPTHANRNLGPNTPVVARFNEEYWTVFGIGPRNGTHAEIQVDLPALVDGHRHYGAMFRYTGDDHQGRHRFTMGFSSGLNGVGLNREIQDPVVRYSITQYLVDIFPEDYDFLIPH